MKLNLSLLGMIVILVSCNAAISEPPPPCSSVAGEAALRPTCTPPEMELNPIGSWEGSLTTLEGGSGSQPFTAEVSAAAGSSSDYSGVFTVGSQLYNVTGAHQSGNVYLFNVPIDEIQPAVTPEEFFGMAWSGMLTETSISGTWFFKEEAGSQRVSGTFALERRP